ncbi:MAG: hypothetical protein ACXWPM_09165 [Bdellovibrionota bacterium]
MSSGKTLSALLLVFQLLSAPAQAAIPACPRESAAAVSPVRDSVAKFLRDYDQEGARRGNRGEYLRRLREVFAMTETGRKIESCFEAAENASVNDDQAIWIDEANPALKLSPELRAAFAPIENPPRSGHFLKTIFLSIKAKPIELLTEYAHERQHGCNATELSRSITALEKAPASPAARKQLDRSRALDEMRAYHRELEFFTEVASALPDELVCGAPLATGSLYGNRDMSMGEYFGDMKRRLEDGSWAPFLLSKMVELGFYKAENILVGRSLAQASSPRIQPDLLKEIQVVTKSWSIRGE